MNPTPECRYWLRQTQRAATIACAVMLAVTRAGAQEGARTELVVFAAASLHDAFTHAGEEFRLRNHGVSLTFNFAGSQQLAEQLVQGAPADIFASADMKQMNAARVRMDTASVRTFARNRLVLAVPNVPGRIVRTLSGLRDKGIKIVLADGSVPAGAYAIEFLSRCQESGEFGSGFREAVLANVVSYEENVKAVLTKIMLDEADAGVVYVSDVAGAAGRSAATIEIPDRMNVTASYPIGRTLDSRSAVQAERFIAFILSDAGQRLLVLSGFTGVTAPVQGR